MMRPGIPFRLVQDFAIASGQTKVLDSGAMQPKSRAPFELDEVLFRVRNNSSVNSGIVGLGGVIWAKLGLGRWGFTNNHVPIWSLARRASIQGELAGVGLSGAVYAGVSASYGYYRWKFSDPVYVPKNFAITGSIFRTPLFDSESNAFTLASTVSVTVSFAGRILTAKDTLPAITRVPYASAFVPTNNQLFSGELDLKNPFDKQLHIRRFTGHIQRAVTAAGGSLSDSNAVVGRGVGATALPGPTVTLKSTKGTYLVRDAVAFERIFDFNAAAWDVNAVLNPNEGYQAILSAAPTAGARPMIGMVGYREEVVG